MIIAALNALKKGNLTPAFYAYGANDPFYNKFNLNADAVSRAGVSVERHVYHNVGYGFGAGRGNCDRILPFDNFYREHSNNKL